MKQLFISIICCVINCELYAQTTIPFTALNNTKELTESILTLQHVENNSATFTFDVADAKQYAQIVEGTNYTMFYIKGMGMLQDIGKPYLPVYQKWIEVSDKSSDISIISSFSRKLNDINVFPTQSPQLEIDEKQTRPFCIDSEFYKSDTLYPQNIVEVSNIISHHGKKYAVVRICPIQYNPKQKSVRCYSKIKFNLTHYTEQSIAESTNRDRNNTSTIQDHYFIVFKNNISTRNALANFVTWKKEQGYKVHLISKNSWANPTQVKDSIKAHYNQCHENSNKYLLIVGNHSMVPTSHGSFLHDQYFVTDYDYSCIENQGNCIRDIAIGRIPYNTSTELRTILNKIIDYQKHPFYNGKALNIGYFERDSVHIYNPDEDSEARRSIRTCEDTKEFIDNQGFSTKRIYYAKQGVHPYYYSEYYSDGGILSDYLINDYPWNGNNNMIVNAINDSLPNLILYCGHGSNNAWGSLSTDTSHIHQLHNTKYPITLSMTCHTGKFAKYVNSSISNQDCFATELLKQPNGGSVAVIASTDKAFSGYLDYFTAALYDTMFPDILNIAYGDINLNYPDALFFTDFSQLFPDNYKIGDAINIACYKIFNSNLVGTNGLLTTCKRMHCFGDPTTEIYTGQAEDLSVVTARQVNDSLIIDTHGVENCSVLLLPKNSTESEMFIRKDSVSGEVSFPNIRTPYSISVQKHNCATYYINAPDIYIQDMDFTDTLYNYRGNRIYIGMDVTEDVEHDEVNVKSGSTLILKGNESVIQDTFEVELGGIFEIR